MSTPPERGPKAADLDPQSLSSSCDSQGTGSSINSEGFSVNLDRDQVVPRIVSNIEKHSTCEIETLLAHLVDLVVSGAPKERATLQEDEDYLQPYLEETTKVAMKLSNPKNEYPQKYVAAANATGATEKNIYGPFTNLTNHGLDELRKLDTLNDRVRAPSKLAIVCQVINTAKLGDHQSVDISFLPLQRAFLASGRSSPEVCWKVLLNSYCLAEHPLSGLGFHDTMANIELKLTTGSILSPLHYSAQTLLQKMPHIDENAVESYAPVIRDSEPATRQETEGSGTASHSNDGSEPLQYSPKDPEGQKLGPVPEDEIARKPRPKTPPFRTVYGERLPPVVQCAGYATEMLCSRFPWINHAINLLVVDDIIWLWWYDRQGAIQSTGFNFIQNLPHYLLLLLCFQRFELEEWGINMDLIGDLGLEYYVGNSSSIQLNQTVDTFELLPKIARTAIEVKSVHPAPPGSGSEDIDSRSDNTKGITPTRITVGLGAQRELEKRYALIGRGTRVHLASFDAGQHWNYVAKFSWAETTQATEPSLVQRALQDGIDRDDKRIIGHLPTITHFFKGSYNTLDVRRKLRVNWHREETNGRELCVVVEKILLPLSRLQGKEFLRAYLECVMCHYAIWKHSKIQHSDPSLNNCMYDTQTKAGIVIDWDLAFDAQSPASNTNRSGTLPFMAMDLLKDLISESPIHRLYRHDLEGFIWILPWVFIRCKGGKEYSVQSLETWTTGDAQQCYCNKHAWHIAFMKKYRPYSDEEFRQAEKQYFYRVVRRLDIEWVKEYNLVAPLLEWAIGPTRAKAERELDTPEVHYIRFWDILRTCPNPPAYLADLLAELELRNKVDENS